MQVINDTEVFEPSECYFAVDPDPDNPSGSMVSITDKSYWDEEGYLNDCFGDHSLPDEIVEQMAKAGITNAMEAVWTSDQPPTKVTEILAKLGFVESEALHFKDLVY